MSEDTLQIYISPFLILNADPMLGAWYTSDRFSKTQVVEEIKKHKKKLRQEIADIDEWIAKAQLQSEWRKLLYGANG